MNEYQIGAEFSFTTIFMLGTAQIIDFGRRVLRIGPQARKMTKKYGKLNYLQRGRSTTVFITK